MQLIDYCDLGDAPEIRVQSVGSILLASPNIVRISFVIKVPGRTEHVAAVHHIWDIADWMDSLPAFRAGRLAIEQQQINRPRDPCRPVLLKVH